MCRPLARSRSVAELLGRGGRRPPNPPPGESGVRSGGDHSAAGGGQSDCRGALLGRSEHIPGAGANHARVESICPERETIT
eukprot:451998-Prorocentrum_minimum.AAC.1